MFFDEDLNEVDYMFRRSPTRTYASKSFETQFGQDAGHPSRYIRRVFDEADTGDDLDLEWTMEVVYITPEGRRQLELHVARRAGEVRKLRIVRAPTDGDLSKLQSILTLDREQCRRLIDMIRSLDNIPVEGENTVYVDDDLLNDVLDDPGAVREMYLREPAIFRSLIEDDADAVDVLALQHRREVVDTMRLWLDDADAFAAASAEQGGPERAWQKLLEAEPWVLGIGLDCQLLTSWDDDRLEQTVAGHSVAGPGKRVDALLRTAGIVRSMAFAEIKHHNTDLLEASHYRAGCWGPSKEVAGAVVQVQQTVHLACAAIGDYLHDESAEGELLPSGTFLLRPRSFLVAGTLRQLTGENGNPLLDKFRSFELFRRNLHEPELMTFDELVARAEWHVTLAAEAEAGN